MKTAKITVVLLAAIAISIVLSVSSGTAEKGFSVQARGEKRFALVIGNGAYKNAGVLTNTVNDANDMEKTLKSLNFEVTAKVNAGLKDMEDAIREFGSKLKRADVGLFYYSGHGVQANGENYLIPTDADIRKESDLKYTAVNAGKVLDEMTDAGNRLNIVILDACRNNSLPKSFKSARSGLAQMDAPSGMLIAYATSPNSTASDGSGRNGTYTANLLKYMKVPGLPIEKMFKEVRKGVLQDSSNNQRPWESVSITDDFYFLADSGSIATEKPKPPEPVKPAEPAKASVSHKPKYNLRKEPVAVSRDDLRLDKNLRPTEFVRNDFRDNGDGTVSDHATGLMWKKSGSDKRYSFYRTDEYVQHLNREKFAGYSDWRVPTIEELMSLITQNKQSNGQYSNPILAVQADGYWSATSDTTFGWFVSLNGGYVDRGGISAVTYYVWPVRSISP